MLPWDIIYFLLVFFGLVFGHRNDLTMDHAGETTRKLTRKYTCAFAFLCSIISVGLL